MIDSDGNLVRHITPELCITELIYGTSYDERHKLKAHVAPDGCRTSFSYDANAARNGTSVLAEISRAHPDAAIVHFLGDRKLANTLNEEIQQIFVKGFRKEV